ncbi:hypothetical protein [Epilithonimonas lactis]|uniref:C1q domain-containing protein n=1 Tax=Epilithonimonas lactis TaxID=421072 RepID=A0A085BG97_9FLAO|nr:hypothetical protein [Epilithonimonas lactis]KFC21492.1 hypothetical protein IO89_15055 [Epilithonimonas lactis]SEP87000.1 hypothetical protein SAMN04488097_0920 [Epilithonimonas lactis]
MKKYLMSFIFFFVAHICTAQVGINTSDPKATLDINGNLKVRNIPSVTSVNSDRTILLRDKNASTGDFEIKEISSDILIIANANAYYASKTGSWSLLDLGLGNSWSKINLTGALDTKLGNAQLFNAGVYTAAQSGTYAVNYEFQFNAGVNLEVLGGKRLGLIKNGNVLWDEKIFDGVRVSLLGITLASVPITSTKLTSLVQLNAGDTLTFAVNVSGLLPVDVALLSSAKVNLYIYKISN